MTAVFHTIHVDLAQLPSILALYDRIQVWRSTTGSGGSYSEITSEIEEAATLVSSLDSPWSVVGQTLTISLSDGDPASLVFTGNNPLRIEEVLTQLETVFPEVGSIDSSSNARLRLTNPLTGTGSSILVSGNAAATLGLSTTKVSGKGPRIHIGNLITKYPFTDLGGDSSYWYKTRFYSTKTRAVSSFYAARQGDVSQILPTSETSKAVINLLDVTGKPIVGRRIILVPVQMQTIPYNSLIYGLLPGNGRIELTTDEAGHAEIELAIGAKLKVFFEGSSYSREFVVPEDDEFDLLTVASTQPDPFTIIQAPPMPIREG